MKGNLTWTAATQEPGTLRLLHLSQKLVANLACNKLYLQMHLPDNSRQIHRAWRRARGMHLTLPQKLQANIISRQAPERSNLPSTCVKSLLQQKLALVSRIMTIKTFPILMELPLILASRIATSVSMLTDLQDRLIIQRAAANNKSLPRRTLAYKNTWAKLNMEL